jgi:thiol-disulfide isomerase/thioredoxin
MAALAYAPALRAAQVQRWAGAAPTQHKALDLQGRPWDLPRPGRALALNFWASWCEPCRSEMPALQQMADLYQDKLTVAAINFKERASTVARFVAAAHLQLPVLLDPAGEVAAAYKVKVFPTTVLFAADGRPRWRITGALDWTSAQAGKLVEGLWA